MEITVILTVASLTNVELSLSGFGLSKDKWKNGGGNFHFFLLFFEGLTVSETVSTRDDFRRRKLGIYTKSVSPRNQKPPHLRDARELWRNPTTHQRKISSHLGPRCDETFLDSRT